MNLLSAGLLLLVAPASAGDPIMPLGQVTAGLRCSAYSVVRGTEPTRFDVARPNARDHLSFSAGRHHCLGAQLARMEGEVGLRVLFGRYPDLRLLPGARRRPTRVLRGYAALPAVLGGG